MGAENKIRLLVVESAMKTRLQAATLIAGIGTLVIGASLGRPARAEKAAQGLSPAEFATVQALIKPQPGEAKWLEIPWEIDVVAARKKAAAQGKPIFFLTGGGHSPLGDC